VADATAQVSIKIPIATNRSSVRQSNSRCAVERKIESREKFLYRTRLIHSSST